MAYTIMFLIGERVTNCISWDAGLEPAKHYARDYLAKRNAERAEVWDQHDAIVFRYEPPASSHLKENAAGVFPIPLDAILARGGANR
jgi:hypothetical protein